jgi:aminoglycoside 2''-phosphotransferase
LNTWAPVPDLLLEEFVPLGEGDFCLAFGGSGQVVRVAKHADAAAALAREACILGRVASQLPVPVPRPTFHSPTSGPAFSVHDEVDGAVLSPAAWRGLSPAGQDRVAGDLARFLRTLHRIPVRIGHRCNLPVLDAAALARQAAQPAARLLHPVLDPVTRQRLDRALASATPAHHATTPPLALIHGDIAPGHLLFDPAAASLTGIIDFGDLALADPARDFIYIYEDFGTGLLAAVLRHYTRNPAALLRRIRLWYLLETVTWTAEMRWNGRQKENRDGILSIRKELRTGGLHDTTPSPGRPA